MLIKTSVVDACQSNLSMVFCRFSRMYGFSTGFGLLRSNEG